MNDHEEFYVGWQDRAPSGIASRVRMTITALCAVIIALACVIPLAQRTIGVAVFQWGTVKDFSGVLEANPYPHLLVQRPGHDAGNSTYYLVAPFKFGLNPQEIQAFDGKRVSLEGTLIFRENQTMIEARPDSIRLASSSASSEPKPETIDLGRQTLVGEIVDSKCYLGVMNPGRFAPHRGCAVRCISGGIPPILVVHSQTGPALHLLLVSTDGSPINKQVLEMVAEPVQITGHVIRQGDLRILRADPATFQRVHHAL